MTRERTDWRDQLIERLVEALILIFVVGMMLLSFYLDGASA